MPHPRQRLCGWGRHGVREITLEGRWRKNNQRNFKQNQRLALFLATPESCESILGLCNYFGTEMQLPFQPSRHDKWFLSYTNVEYLQQRNKTKVWLCLVRWIGKLLLLCFGKYQGQSEKGSLAPRPNNWKASRKLDIHKQRVKATMLNLLLHSKICPLVITENVQTAWKLYICRHLIRPFDSLCILYKETTPVLLIGY